MALNNTQERNKNWFLTINAIKARNAAKQTTNLDPITYNPRYPGFDEANYKKLESKIDQLGLTWYEREQAMDELYVKALPIVQNEIKNSDRREIINQNSYEASQIEDKSERAVAKSKLTVVELTQQLKEKYNIDPTEPDEEVFNSWINSIPDGEQLLLSYLNNGDKTLLYAWGLEEKPKESWDEKYADLAAWVMQSPGKWGYNMIGQWIDKLGKRWAEKMEGTELAKWVQDKAIDLFWEDEVKAYQEQMAKEKEEGTDFNWRKQTDITKVLVWEDRAKSWWTKWGEIVGDIASWIALTAPMASALAPAMVSQWAWNAALLWAFEGGLDTLASQYWTQGNLDVSPTQAILWFWLGALWWWVTNKLANLPKTQQDSIRKEASWYIEKSIKPTVKGKQSQAAYDQFIDDTLDVTDWMSKNKELLEYTDDAWEIVRGKLPENLRETSEALGNMKKYIYDQYNSLAQQAWDAGARVNLNKLYDKLDDLEREVWPNMANTSLVKEIEKFKNQLLQYSDDAWTIAIKDAQDTMQYYNKILDAYFKNPWAYANDASKNIVVANLKRGLSDSVNDSLDDALNASINNWSKASDTYKYWKQLYGKIKTIEDEVSKRALVEARKNTKGLSTDIIDALAWGNFVEWLLTQSPTNLVKWAVMKWINAYNKYLNNPNTQIRNLFKLVDSVNVPSTVSNTVNNLAQNVAPAVSEAVVPWGIVAWAREGNSF